MSESSIVLGSNMNVLSLKELEMVDGGINAGKIAAGVGFSIAAVGSAAAAFYVPVPAAKVGFGATAFSTAIAAGINFYEGFTE